MTDKLSPPTTSEDLSALMDGELGDFETRRLVQRLSGDPELRARWARYHLVASILQREPCHAVGSLQLADAIQAAIQQGTEGERAGGRVGWHKPFASFAVAASVALAVVASVQWQQEPAETPQLAATMEPQTIMPRHSDPAGGAVAPLLVSQPFAGAALPGKQQPERFQLYRVDWTPDSHPVAAVPVRNIQRSDNPENPR